LPCVVVDKRYHNAGIPSLIVDILEVFVAGEGDPIAGTILVLRLEQDDRPTVGDLGFGNNGTNVFHVAEQR
jgi:hypothetical protein